MDLSRLLLMLLCVAVSVVQDVQCRPIDFVCDDHARRDMNVVKDIEAAMSDCHVSALLPSPVQLPCVKIHKASWEKKSTQMKRGEVQAALGMLAQGVRITRTLTPPGCQLSLLKQLERSVTNYLYIVTHLELMDEAESKDTACISQDTQNLGQVLWHFGRLLTGKLEWLMKELQDKCKMGRLDSKL